MSDLNAEHKGKSSEVLYCLTSSVAAWETVSCVRGDVRSVPMCWHKGKSDARQKNLCGVLCLSKHEVGCSVFIYIVCLRLSG